MNPERENLSGTNNENKPYVETRESVRHVRSTHVPLEPLVRLWRDGKSAETIREAFPTLRLADIYGALAYYFDHQAQVDQELAEGQAQFETQRAAAEAADPARHAALRQMFAVAHAQHSAS